MAEETGESTGAATAPDMTHPDVVKAIKDAGDTAAAAIAGNRDEILAEKNKLKEAHNALKTKVDSFGGVDAIDNIFKAAGDAEDQQDLKDGNFKGIIERQNAKHVEYNEKQSTKWGEERQTLTDSNTALNGQIRDLTIGSKLRDEAAKAGVAAGAIDDVLARGMGQFGIEDGKIVCKDAAGMDRKLADGKTLVTPKTFVESLKESAPHLFVGSTGAGAKGSAGTRADGRRVVRMSEIGSDMELFNKYTKLEKEGKVFIDKDS